MKELIVIVFLVCLGAPSRACLNSLSGTTLDGHSRRFAPRWLVGELLDSRREILQSKGEQLEEKLRGKCEFTNRNDYAIGLIYLGRYDEAILLLQALEKERSGEYATAANLGTAYELSGKNELALQWIQEGIRRNSASHAGSEWVHVEILRAKVRQDKDGKYFDTHSVLNLDPKTITVPSKLVRIAEKERPLEEVRDAIHYQLRERLKFVKSNDVVVASLLFDNGLLEAATRTVETGRSLMLLAAEYGYPAGKLAPFYAQFDHAIGVAKVRRMVSWGTIGAAVVGLAVLAVKRRRIRVM